MKPRVFIVQGSSGRLDFSPAAEYGELVHLLADRDSVFRMDRTLSKLSKGIKDITTSDFILPVGNPTLIGIAIALAADHLEGNVKVLQWLGKEKEYIAISAKLWT